MTAGADLESIDFDKLTTGDLKWYTALPTPVQPYFSSIQGAVQSVVDKEVKGAAATAGPAVKVAGAVAAGLVGAVAML